MRVSDGITAQEMRRLLSKTISSSRLVSSRLGTNRDFPLVSEGPPSDCAREASSKLSAVLRYSQMETSKWRNYWVAIAVEY
jgi:hypothetical protein